ncbi:MAG: tRNA (adenosine(37)-N6)-threonylcarbamoyltransferase complex transferase subunit TsaD [Candidatus Peregrinibacteria bacterium]
MRILGIETSCDETSAAVVLDGRTVESNVIASSRELFAQLGGVIPEEAARKQLECILPVIHQSLEHAHLTMQDIDAVAVTRGPGLLVSLLVGTTVARTLAHIEGKPLISVHHTLGHLSSPWLDCHDDVRFPLLSISASGGHTELWLRRSHTEGLLLGSTHDDAAGEAFDKGAELLGLPYPGGPAIAALALDGDEMRFPFPSPLAHEPGMDFSYSGLKTALRYTIQGLEPSAISNKLKAHPSMPLGASSSQLTADLAASYQYALCRHLVDRLQRAIVLHPEVREIHLVGGVSANIRLRSLVAENAGNRTVRHPLTIPYCTDNAAMIAAAAYFLVSEKGMPSEALPTAATLHHAEIMQ